MLVDVEFDLPDPVVGIARAIGATSHTLGNSGGPIRLRQGIYEITHHSINYELGDHLVTEYPFWPLDLKIEVFRTHAENHLAAQLPDDYGVCDYPAQIVEKFPGILVDPRHFVIGVTEVRRENQPGRGGWRWHKWGEYIGEHKPQYEYLYDEKDIDLVWCYRVCEVK